MDTYDDYVEALEKLYVIQDIDAWCPAIRSKTFIGNQTTYSRVQQDGKTSSFTRTGSFNSFDRR